MKRYHSRFGDKLEILLYPSDEFANEEYAEPKRIAEFVSKKMGLPTQAPGIHLMAKVNVNGANADPVWKLCKKAFPGKIEWNFAGVFVFDQVGECVLRTTYQDSQTLEKTIAGML
jgi:glutathione peroxidase|tara:strand:+ start:189 stop:533 length:345 start_codon:yes stop_codon:yes gene_type:complete